MRYTAPSEGLRVYSTFPRLLTCKATLTLSGLCHEIELSFFVPEGYVTVQSVGVSTITETTVQTGELDVL